jgi:hypothetical protein
MRFAPKTDHEIETEGLCPEGWHEAEVLDSTEKVSSSNNEMIELRLKVYTPNGERMMRDWLLPSFPKKLKHFCDATGMDAQYKLGTLTAADCLGKSVMVEVVHKTGKGEYEGRTNANAADYKKVERSSVAARPKPAPKPMPANVEISPDDIPF